MPGRIRKKSLSELDLSTITRIVLSADEERHFARGIALFVVYLVYAPDPDPPTGSYDEAKENLPHE